MPGASKLVTMPHTTTTEIKCGKYVMVCTVFLNMAFFTSLSSKARIIGAGNANNRLYKLISIVFAFRPPLSYPYYREQSLSP